MNRLKCLARLLKWRNQVDHAIAALIGRPAERGHIGEYIASRIFNITLIASASQKSYDGRFGDGPLAGHTVNIKWYGKMEGLLDINSSAPPDYYLVMTGPESPPAASRGQVRPLVIDHVFLFESRSLLSELKSRGVKIGDETSIPKALWEQAEIYPNQQNTLLFLSQKQREALRLFGSHTCKSGKDRCSSAS